MNTVETVPAIAVMQAFCEGKTIESLLCGKWVEVKDPCWNWDDCTYRIKPGPREFWIFPDGEDYRASDFCKLNLDGKPYPGQIHVREVE